MAHRVKSHKFTQHDEITARQFRALRLVAMTHVVRFIVNCEFASASLDTSVITGGETAINLADHISNVLSFMGLVGKVPAITTDNAADITSAVKNFNSGRDPRVQGQEARERFERRLTRTPSASSHLHARRAVFPSRGFVVIRLLASHLGEPGSIPGGVAPRFSYVGIVSVDVAVRLIFSGISPFTCSSIPLHTLLHSSALKTWF
ncbi:hypothetical protein PR048_023355 [Dryococelus australis]|uniref:Transposase n=1 Tax=Dryococelus australis TaxID=614101 RepID=A0ABQ9GTW8_9NEOP|nr:hypothetical protein PR048_023355 [Dryococelus australis]